MSRKMGAKWQALESNSRALTLNGTLVMRIECCVLTSVKSMGEDCSLIKSLISKSNKRNRHIFHDK